MRSLYNQMRELIPGSSVQTLTANPTQESWISLLLDRVSIRHILHGRIRFHFAFAGDEILSDTLRRELHKLETVRLESFSERTSTILVTFDQNRISPLDVTMAVLGAVKSYAKVHGDCDPRHHHHSLGNQAHDEDCDHDHSATATDAGIRKELLKLGLTGAALGYFVYKKIKNPGSARPSGPLTDIRSLLTIATGYPIFKSGLKAVQSKKKASDDTLISIAVVATLLMGESLTGLSVVWLINLGKLLEAITLKRSRTAVKELMDVTPLEAWVLTTDGQPSRPVRKNVSEVIKGETIRVFAGEKVPLDGTVIRGTALVKESFITGEPLPRRKRLRDEVYAGSLLEDGEIDLIVRNLVTETVVARMINAIENIRENKAPIEKIGNRFAAKFVPISLGISVATFVFTGDLRRAITMLVIACPCAAGLATPTAVSASIGQAARRGILIKGGLHVEAAAHINTVVFDKTGTLTTGHPEISHSFMTSSGENFGFDRCLTLAASGEQHCSHPLAFCLVRAAEAKNFTLQALKEFKTIAGRGVEASLENGVVLHIGSEKFMHDSLVVVPLDLTADHLSAKFLGESLVYLAENGILLSVFVVQDKIRPEAKETISKLQKMGIKRIILATGDLDRSAQYVARQLGILEVHSELLPEEKLNIIDELQKNGLKVAMIGDGINDAQAFINSDLSIAMGAGRCDVAIETADVTLARDNLSLVVDTLDISRKTLHTIHQNFFFSIGINGLGVGVGALGKLSPFAAAIVHNASTIAVVLNSFRLGREVARGNPLTLLKEIKI